VKRRAGDGAGGEIRVRVEAERGRGLHLLVVDPLAVVLQDTSAAATDAAWAPECERAHPEAVVLEVGLQEVLAGRQRVASLPTDTPQADQVPGEDRLALEHIEPVAGEAAALGDQHA